MAVPGYGYAAGMGGYGARPDKTRLRSSNERSILASIYNRIAIDVAAVKIRHVQVDAKGRFQKEIDSELNRCLTLEPNLDQGPRQSRQAWALTMMDDGVVAIVPVDWETDTDGEVDYTQLRGATIKRWLPRHVTVDLYNDHDGTRKDITLPKSHMAIVENPLYSVMNETNSTHQRLTRKLNLLDIVDDASSSGKLDMIIQLPYAVHAGAQQKRATDRLAAVEEQLKGNAYGIAYIDATEKITQLNRPVENNLLKQIDYLTKMLWGEMGLTEEIMNGTADEKAMLNYFNRTVEPIITAFVEGMQRSFIGAKRTKAGERIQFHKEPFKLVPISQLADIVDKFRRNAIVSPNEVRDWLGLPPSDDPNADSTANSNMPQEGQVPAEAGAEAPASSGTEAPTGDPTVDALDEFDSFITDTFKELGVDENAIA
jgi:phage portal protein BeeE